METVRQIGSGFSGTLLSGKTHNDEFYVDENGRTRTRTNRSGGVQGGISNGETIVVRVVSRRGVPGYSDYQPGRRWNWNKRENYRALVIFL